MYIFIVYILLLDQKPYIKPRTIFFEMFLANKDLLSLRVLYARPIVNGINCRSGMWEE